MAKPIKSKGSGGVARKKKSASPLRHKKAKKVDFFEKFHLYFTRLFAFYFANIIEFII